MRKYFFIISALPVYLFSTLGLSASPTPQAGSGLILMPTAEILNDKEDYFSLSLDHRSYIVNGASANNSEVQFTSSYLLGIADNYELGVSASLAQDVSEKNGALRDISINGKYQFSTPGNGDTGISLSAYSTLFKADSSDNIGSGETKSGANINFSWTTKDISYHLALGGGKTDIKSTSPSVSYFSDSFSSFALGIEVRPIQNLAFSVEIDASNKNDLTNIMLMPGLKFASNNNVVYHLGIGYSIPDNRAEPAYRILAGVSFGQDKKTRPTLDTQLQRMENRLTALESGKKTTGNSEIQQSINAMERRIDALASLQLTPAKNQRESSALRVELINTSGVSQLGLIVAESLAKSNNYLITRLISDGEPQRKTTHIYYREGLSRYAISLGHALPGDQIISQRYNIPASADLIIFIGTDLKPMLR